MLRKGVHPRIVQDRLGHAKVGTTLDIYSHVTPGLQQAAPLSFEKAMESARAENPALEGVPAPIGTPS